MSWGNRRRQQQQRQQQEQRQQEGVGCEADGWVTVVFVAAVHVLVVSPDLLSSYGRRQQLQQIQVPVTEVLKKLQCSTVEVQKLHVPQVKLGKVTGASGKGTAVTGS